MTPLPLTHGPLIHDDGTATFRVWAPLATAVQVRLDDRSHALTEVDAGWFSARVPATHGMRYGFVLDDGATRPDPATRWQPDGVHGRSAVLDPRRFDWSPGENTWRAALLSTAVLYELHIGTFTPDGTFAAASVRLPRLRELGITHVEVMPVNAFNGTAGWGYDGVSWYAVHEPYGGPEAFAEFVDAAHRAGLGVVLDVVYNHLGPSGNYLGDFGPYTTAAYRTPWGDALNLDGAGSDPVRAFIIDNALQWFADFHVDALRLDAVHGLLDQSAVHILAQLSDATAALSARLDKPLALIAESDRNDPLTITPRFANGAGMDAQWSDDLHHGIHVALTGEQDGYYQDYRGLEDVAAAYTRGFVYDGGYSGYRRRTVGAPLPPLIPGWRLVTCTQNHDQVGNRAAGERLETLVPPALVRVAAALLCAAPSTPMLFMGEEHAETAPFQYFTSHPEPELAEAVRRGRAEEFAAFSAFAEAVPDPQDPETVRRSTIDWANARGPEGISRRALWADLLHLRRRHAALANGRRDLVEILEVGPAHLVLVRRDPHAPAVMLAVNLTGDDLRRVLLPTDVTWQLVLSTDEPAYGGFGRRVHGPPDIGLPARSAAFWIASDLPATA